MSVELRSCHGIVWAFVRGMGTDMELAHQVEYLRVAQMSATMASINKHLVIEPHNRIPLPYRKMAYSLDFKDTLIDTLIWSLVAYGPTMDKGAGVGNLLDRFNIDRISVGVGLAIEELTIEKTQAWVEVIEEVAERVIGISVKVYPMPVEHLLQKRLADHFYYLWNGGWIESIDDFHYLQNGPLGWNDDSEEQVAVLLRYPQDEARVLVGQMRQRTPPADRVEHLMKVAHGQS